MSAATVAGGRGRAPSIDARTAIRLGLLIGLVVAFYLSDPDFLATGNIYSIGQSFALLGLVAVGLSLTMMAGEFDLSVGAMVPVAGVISIKLAGSEPIVGILVAVAFGLAIGALNGIVVSKLRVSSLVVTVGSLIMLTGLAFQIAGSKVVSTEHFEVGFRLEDPILQIFSIRSLIAIALIVGVAMLLTRTLPGRDIYAAGSAREAARAAGVKVDRAIVIAFVLSGGFAALAGALLAYSLAGASPSADSNLLLQAASAAIIGGVSLAGGRGTAFGVAIGALVLTVLNNGLALIGVSSAVVELSNGALLLAVVVLDAVQRGGTRFRLGRGRGEAPAESAAAGATEL